MKKTKKDELTRAVADAARAVYETDARRRQVSSPPGDVHANALEGPVWDAVRRVRTEIFGDTGEPLEAERVPPALRPLLPYASMLGTGEEGAWQRFWDVMDAPTRKLLLKTVFPLARNIDAFADDPSIGCPEQYPMRNLLNMCNLFDE